MFGLSGRGIFRDAQFQRFGFQFMMTVIGETPASSRTEFITNDWPLEETMYCCLFWFIAVLPTFVLNSGTGAPISGLVPSEGRRMLTAISHSSDPI